MTQAEQVDQFFALLEDEDVDFLGSNSHQDVPVLTYRWSKNEAVARCSLERLVQVGREVMEEAGMKRIVSREHHLRGDTDTGQRVKMTVLRSGGRAMYLLMTAGLPGTREKAKSINHDLAARIERRVQGE